MAALSQTINNVLGGVSQQPDPVKLPGQVREAENVYLDPTFGCRKRPGTQFISKLDNNIPANAKWIPVFRDDDERYVACIYHSSSGAPVVRVWAADSGQERTVTIDTSASTYLQSKSLKSIKALTINDYTLLVNGEQTVTMNSAAATNLKQEALVVVNQVAYNTTYSIDFLKDGAAQTPVKIYRATRLSVLPATMEVFDSGACSLQATQSFVINGAGTGLGFNLVTQCTPTLETTNIPGQPYPTGAAFTGDLDLTKYGLDGGRNAWWTAEVGVSDNFQVGSYVYATKNFTIPNQGDITIRFEAQVVNQDTGGVDANGDPVFVKWFVQTSEQIVSFATATDGTWVQGTEWLVETTLSSDLTLSSGRVIPSGSKIGFPMRISAVATGPDTPQYEYKSVYRTTLELSNGGQGWSIGDSVSVTMSGQTYDVTVEDTAFSFSYASEATVSYTTAANTSSGALGVGDIVSNLVTGINNLADYSAEAIGNVIYLERNDTRVFNLAVRGGAADRALYGLKDSVNDISLLPSQGHDGMTIKVSNSAQSDADDYFVKFVTTGGIPGQGSWEETVGPGIPVNLNNSSMPHVLIREDSGNFTVRSLSSSYGGNNFWAGREVGDEKTNPAPTFVNKRIRDCFFFMNRLGFLSEDTVVMSQAGDYFNFFQGSAISISDADPIDMAASSTKPAKLKAAIGTPAGLLLFAENSQFLMSTEDVAFGPSTVKMKEITNYSYNSDVMPVETGVSILFATSAETFTKVFELSTDSLQARPLVSENTRIIPEYIPPNLSLLTAVPNSSMVIMGTGDETLYIFKFFNTGNERNFAGWAKWVMSTPIKMASFAHDTGYFVGINAANEFILSRMELIDDPETSPIRVFDTSFTPRLDHYLYESQITTSTPSTGLARLTLPSGFSVAGKTPFLVATFKGTETFYISSTVETAANGDIYIDVDSELVGTEFIVGLGYDMKVVLPSFFLKSGEDIRADRRNPPMVENMFIDLYFSGRYQAKVSKTGYEDRTVDLDTNRSDLYLSNSAAIDDFSTRTVPIFSRGDLAKVTIIAPDPLPAAFTSYSWEGHYSTRGVASR